MDFFNSLRQRKEQTSCLHDPNYFFLEFLHTKDVVP